MEKNSIRILALLTALLIAVLSGCGGGRVSRVRLTVVTSCYPVYIAALNVSDGVEGVELINMTQAATGCLHDYQLSPQDLVTLDAADLFLINGAGMEAFLNNVFKARPNLPIAEAAQGLALLSEDGYSHTHEGIEEEYDNHEGHDHGHGDNAHVWTSITLYKQYVQNIAAAFSACDPVHAAQYTANAAAYVNRLESLRIEIQNELSDIEFRDIVTFHEAFAYFAAEFDLYIAATIESEPGASPGPQELIELAETVREHNCRALFTEPQYTGRAAETIARETGAGLYELDPGVTGPMEKDAYIKAMRQNAATLKEALGT